MFWWVALRLYTLLLPPLHQIHSSLKDSGQLCGVGCFAFQRKGSRMTNGLLLNGFQPTLEWYCGEVLQYDITVTLQHLRLFIGFPWRLARLRWNRRYPRWNVWCFTIEDFFYSQNLESGIVLTKRGVIKALHRGFFQHRAGGTLGSKDSIFLRFGYDEILILTLF
jgi:hypothetical protein